jgi:hypothetical protein
MFENKAPRRIFVRKKQESAGRWRKLHHEELHNFNSSPNIITVMKPRRIGWAGHVAWTIEVRNVYKF